MTAGAAVLRLAVLHLASRRAAAAAAVLGVAAAGLWAALHGHWDSYGALQLPLVFEAAAAAVIAGTTASPFGETERATGRVTVLRLGSVLALTAGATAALMAAAAGVTLAGGVLDVVRNTAGLTGIGLLCAAVLGGGLAWTGPLAYLVVSAYTLYAAWHGGALSTPWIWPARPSHDRGAWLCAGLVCAAGIAVIALRGARDRPGE